MISLKELVAGQVCQVLWMNNTAGAAEAARSCGIREGESLTIVSNVKGCMIVRLREKRIALSEEIAGRIRVGLVGEC